ncbi:MAG: sulfite exporter TauE/SafE family protein [Spongiibacter marinus]|uniref:sulfite exporter TauE/SafE family protein n=1 Tax=Spongiibacter marinus TaxID=354246 RepID=UPI003C39E504
MTVVLIYLAVGALAGLSAGLFGVGGGLVIVPALIYCFALQGVSSLVAVQLAVGTSLASIVFTSVSSVRAHQRHGNVDWPTWRLLAPGIAIGVVGGVALAASLPGERLKLVFGIFALLIAAQMAFGLSPPADRQLPARPQTLLAGGFIGFLSALFGIGGGSLSVPFLTWCNVKMQRAVATSAACGLPIAIVGALTNIVAGYGHSALPAWSSGFVYWPALLAIILCSTPCAKLGANLAQKLPARRLKQGFALFLLAVGSHFIYGAL